MMSTQLLIANWESISLYWFIVWTLTATAVWAGAAGWAACLRRNSAHARHRVWMLSMFAVLIAPLVAPLLPLPRWWSWSNEQEANRIAVAAPPSRVTDGEVMVDAKQSASALPNSERTSTTHERSIAAPAPVARLASTGGAAASRPEFNETAPRPLAWRSILIATWLGGAALSLLMFAIGLWRIRRLRRRAVGLLDGVETTMCRELRERLGIRRNVKLLVTPRANVPFLAGIFDSAIVLPSGVGRWAPDRLRVVLTHELIHLQRNDVLWEIVAQLAMIPAWFHALGWFATKRLRVERELACDDAVLIAGERPADYAEQLVEVAAELCTRSWRPAPVVAIAGASPIERRVHSILDPRVWRAPLGRWRTIGLSACMAGLVMVVAVLSPASGDDKAAPSKSPAKTPEQATSAASDADRQIAAALKRPTTIRLQNASLDDALLALSATCGLPIAFYEEPFQTSGAEISPTVAVQANGEPLGSVLRSLAQSAIGGAKIGISVVAKDGALRISADRPADRHSGGGDRLTTLRGAVRSASGQPAADCSIVIRMQSGILVLHADAEGRFSVPMPVSDRVELSVIARSADGSQMGAQEVPQPIWVRQGAAPIELTLDRVKTISVLVSDGNGRPVPRAHAAIIEVPKGNYGFQKAVFSSYTDDSGKLALRLPEKFQIGFVYAFKSGAGLDYHSYVAPRDNPDVHAKVPPQPDGLVRLSLAGSRRATIKCIDEGGEPCAGIEVTPWILEKPGETGYLNDGRSWHVFTNDRGEAIFGWIPTWQEKRLPFSAYPAGGRSADDERAIFDPQKPSDQIIVTIHRTVELSGTVRDAGGKPVAGADVELSGGGYDQRRFSHRAKSGDRGQYRFDVPPLEVFAIAAHTGDRRQASPVRDGIAVYPQKPVTGIDLTLAPTTRVFGRVALGPGNKPAVNYHVYATTERLARPPRIPDPDFPHAGRKYLAWPQLQEMAETDAQGRFEFHLATGQYNLYTYQPTKDGGMIIDPDEKLHHSVKIASEEQLEINMHGGAPPEYGVLHGTVVNGGKPVPGALVEGASQPGDAFKAVADDHGAFDIRVPNTPAVVFAKSKDGSLAGVARIGVGERNITVPIAPTATCTMRLLHKDQKPYSSDQTVKYSVIIPMVPSNRRSGGRLASGGEVHPDRDGRLILPGMVIGEIYQIWLRDSDGQFSGQLTTVRPHAPGDQSLLDITFDPPPPYHPPTLDEQITRRFDRPAPAVQRNRDAKDSARLDDARILITFADPQSPVTKALYKLYLDDETLPQIVNNNYLPMAVPTGRAKRAEAEALAKELGVEMPGDDSPLVVAEATDGKVLGVLTAAELVTKDKEINMEALAAFVKRHAPPALDARKLLDDALAQAKRENKRVLVQETAVWCGPCDRLATFLDQNRALWEKDYIWVQMNIRWSGEAEIMKRLRGEAEGGLPWLAILDGDGKVLVTSNKPDDGANIGYPSDDDSIKHFMHMLKTTAQRTTDEDFARLKTALEATSKEH